MNPATLADRMPKKTAIIYYVRLEDRLLARVSDRTASFNRRCQQMLWMET